MKILLVDDKEENLYLLEKLLQGNGYETISAGNGAEALEAALKNPPDMAISDILMPVMDGFTLCREWRKNKLLKTIPFVFYTATYTDPKDEEFALSLGADRFIIKPQEMNAFLKIIKETFSTYKGKKLRLKPVPPIEEKVFLKEYNEALVRKLEDKVNQLESIEGELRNKNSALEKDIEERKRTEEKLKQTQLLLRSSLDSPTEMIILSIDRNYRYMYFNKAHKEVMKYAYNTDVEIGMNVLDCISSQKDRRTAKSNYDRAMSGESHSNIEEFGDVNRASYESFFNPIFNEKNEIIGITAFAKDITERRRIEQKLQNSEKRLASIFNTVGDVIFLLDVEKDGEYRFASVNQMFLKTTGLPLEALIGKRVHEIIPEPSLTMVLSMYKQAIENKTIVRWEEISEYPTGKLVGEVSIAPFFDENGKCTLLIGTVHDITERKQAESLLRERDNQFKKLAAQVPGMLFQFKQKPDGTFCVPFTSEGVRDIFNCSPHDVRDDFSPIAKVILPEDLNRVVDSIKQSARQLTLWQCEYRVQIPGKSIRWMDGHSMPEKQDDGTIIWHGFNTDITERKRAEEALRESERRLSEAQKMAQLGNWIWDVKTGHVEWSEEVFNIFRLDPKTFTPQIDSILDLSPWPEDHERDKELIAIAMKSHEKGTYEQRFLRPDKSIGYYISSFQGKYDEKDNLISIVGTVQDITERKRADEVLRQKTALLEAQLNSSIDGIIIVDSQGKKIIQNQRTIDLWKIPKHIAENEDDQMQVHHVMHMTKNPEQFVNKITDLYNHPNETSRDEVELTDGTVLERYSAPVLGGDGKNYGRIWAFHDITDRKRAEEALRRSENQYRMLFDQMTSGFAVHEIILDKNNHPVDYRFLQVNPIFEQLTGLHSKDIIGKTVLEVLPKTEPSFIERYGEVALTGKDIQFESYTQELNKYFSIRAYSPERGKFATVFEDITKRKQTEDALAKEQFIMNMLMDNVPDHIYFKDKESRFIRMNKAQATTFGLADPSEALGKTDFDFFTEQHARPAIEDEQKIMRTGQSIIGIEEKETWPDGSMTWVNTTKMPLRDKKGEIVGTFGISKDITTRKRAEEELSKSEEKYRSIFENVQDVYYEAAIDGTILEVSPSIEILSKGQYKRFDLIGHSMNDFYSDVKQRQALLTLLLEQGAVSDFEVSLKNRDGSLVPCAISSKIFIGADGRPEKIIGSMRDITERKQADEALRETRDYLENLLSFANAPIIVWSPDFKITRFNLAIEKLTGYTVYEVVGKHLEILFPPESRKSSLSLIAPTSEGDHLITAEMPILCKNGSIRTVLWSTANIYAANGQVLVSTIAQGQDITEQKKLQQELLQSQKMQSIGTLAGGIAHDFNNILGIILGYTSFIEREMLTPEKRHESLQIIKNAVGRGAALVGQILTFARKTDVVFEPMNVTDLILELLSMLKQTFPRVITFIENIDRKIPRINADRTQLHQVMLNLCVNARDAMPNGGTITIKAEKQTKSKVQEKFHDADHDAYICISVTDTGEGMSEATRRQIFDPFFTTKEQGKGTGLGLAVVYGVVQSHHGFIDVESELGRGTTFRLYFPIPLAGEMPNDVPFIPESFTEGGTETILLVEDEEALIEIVHLLLESNGYKVYAAKDGAEAVNMYKQHGQEIDIVLTDMGLPGMTGMDVFKKLKEINPKVNVIIASGFLEPKVRSELDKTGAKGFIQKPYSPDEVLQKLREILDKKKDT